MNMRKTINFENKPELILEMSFRDAGVSSEEDQRGILDGEDTTAKRLIEGIATVAAMDDNFIEVTPRALRNAEQDLMVRSTILENHDTTRAIGRVLESKFDAATDSLLIKGFISEAENTVWQKITEGVLNKFSISWRSLEYENVYDEVLGREKLVVHDMKIFEVSVVSVPAIAEASLTGWVERTLKDNGYEVTEVRTVLPFRKDPAAPRARRWNAPSAVRRLRRRAGGPKKEQIDWDSYSQGFAYVGDSGNRFADYKFPVRDVVNGRLVSVFRAVSAAAGRLLRSDLSGPDKKAIARRLLKEYREIHKVDDEDIPEGLAKLAGK